MTLTRKLEPEIMDDPLQVEGFDSANRYFSIYNFIFWFKFLKCTTGTVLDLGCGTGQHLIELAKIYPNLNFIGVDASPVMLEKAKQNVDNANFSDRIKFINERIENLKKGNYAAVISAGTLHHIPDPSLFWNTVNNLAGDSPTLVMDILRPDSEDSLIKFMKSARDQNSFYRVDLYNSYRAAHSKEEIFNQLENLNIKFQHYEGTTDDRGSIILILLNTDLDL